MKWLRRLAVVAGVVLLLELALWLGVPRLVAWQAQTRGAELLDRQVSVGEVRFNPLTLELTLSKLVVAGQRLSQVTAQPQHAAEPLLLIERLHANLAFWPLWRGVPVLQALELDAPRVHVARVSDGHYDIDDLIAALSPRDRPAQQPAHFALYNLQVRDAQLAFDDRPVGARHVVEALQLSLPFVSNLPEKVDVTVRPRLAFRLHGATFDSGAQATPFAATRHGVLKLATGELDVRPYLGYLPQSLPVRLVRGVLSADLSLEFTQTAGHEPSAVLSGWVAARELAMAHPDGRPLASWRQLRLGLRDVQPLQRRMALDTLRIEAPEVHLARDAAGRVDFVPAGPAASASAAGSPPAEATPWQVSLDKLELAGGRVLWIDAAVRPAAALQWSDVALAAQHVQWPLAGAVPVSFSAQLGTQGGAAEAGRISAEGSASDRRAQLKLSLSGLALQALGPYVAQALVPRVEGRLSAQARLDWAADAAAPRLQLALDEAKLDGVRVQGTGAGPGASVDQLALADAEVDLVARRARLAKVSLVRPMLALARDAQGRLDVADWLRQGASPPVAPAHGAAHPPGSGNAASPWRLQLQRLQLDDGRVQWSDAAVPGATAARPLRAELQQVQLAVQDLAWSGTRPEPPAKLQWRARVVPLAGSRSRALQAGTVEWKGEAGLQPVSVNGQVRIARFPLQMTAAYFSDQVPVRLLRAEAGYAGQVSVRQQPAGWTVALAGDALLGDVHVTTLPDASVAALATGADELLNWQSLALRRVRFSMKPGARPRLEVGEAALNDFYASLVVTEQGHFNLRDMRAPAAAASGPAAASTGVQVNAPTTAPTTAPASAPTATSAAPASAGASAPAALPLDIVVGGSTLTNGHIDFSDHFVQPHYSADLTELNGELGPFSSASGDLATLKLRGRAAKTALLEISGRINPTVKPPLLDIQARATDLELPPLSPYAGKYAGYAIERGKLSLDVAYKIDANGRLEASNQLVLNQLTFGERVESPSATKLPVLLAVALLKDRNGVIDINLPISGSLNDPKFSMGGLVVKVIVNLLAKAITAPFALLAGGGTHDLSLVEFTPGTALIAPDSAATIDKVAKALNDRPALRMTVTGAADMAAEREAYQRAVIEERLLAERRRQALRAGEPASAPVALNADQRARLVKRLYEQTDMPDKPRNMLGLAKDLPVPEMEALLRRHVPVTEEAMREVALERGLAVRDALVAKGLPGERLFLALPRLHTTEAGEGAAWTPRVQLSLSTR